MRRSTAAIAIPSAATRIIPPSRPLEKYSALSCPKGWSSSGGLATMLSTTSATHAATRLITDSSASDSKPTDPVNQYANPFRPMMTIEAAIDNQAKRVRDGRFCGMSRAVRAELPSVRIEHALDLGVIARLSEREHQQDARFARKQVVAEQKSTLGRC